MKEKLLVSACLLGENCKYNGGNNYSHDVERLGNGLKLSPSARSSWAACPPPESRRNGWGNGS